MGLELPGITRIDTSAEARAHARRWSKMAREIDTPDAPDSVKEHARELRQRSQAANDWARRQEDAITVGQQAHDEHLENEERKVVPIRGRGQTGTEEPQRAKPTLGSRAQAGARAAGHAAYTKARPPAMRMAVRGKHHFFEGVSEPFGPAGDAWDIAFYALGATLGVIMLADLIRAPKVIADVSTHGLGFLHRATSLADPFTGALATAPRAGAGSARPVAPHPGTN